MKLAVFDYALLFLIFMSFMCCVSGAVSMLKAAVLPKSYDRGISTRIMHLAMFLCLLAVSLLMWGGVVSPSISFVRTVYGW